MMPQQELQRRAQTLAREALSLGTTQIQLSTTELSLHFPNGDTVSYPTPLPYLFEEAADSEVPTICVCSPGTLTSENVLVGADGQTWLADFGQAGTVPLLWDFVCLEAAVRFDLIESTDLQALHHFEARLTAPTELNERLDTLDVDAPFRKALSVIQHLRRLASCSGGRDPIPYYKGLLLCALSEVAGYIPGPRHVRQALGRLVHALLSAAMIYGRMLELAENPLPDEIHRVARGIRVDEANRRLWVEGKRVELSPLEFDLLLYLYQHAGQLCTRRSIVEEGLRNSFMDDNQEASRINTLMRRLRKKIEPDPNRPRHIRTVRGHGYTLDLEDQKRS
jgi:hypothetical protein